MNILNYTKKIILGAKEKKKINKNFQTKLNYLKN